MVALINACYQTPVYSHINNVVLGGGTYKFNELFKEGLFDFGRISGIDYEVEVNSDIQYHVQYSMCCPDEVPDL